MRSMGWMSDLSGRGGEGQRASYEESGKSRDIDITRDRSRVDQGKTRLM